VIAVSRDFNALLIPNAIPIKILAGTEVEITQYKGGNATVYFEGNLARVSTKDLDAIGLEIDPHWNNIIKSNSKTDLTMIWEILKTCYDPEIPVNIVDLGLVYNCQIIEQKIIVSMTLTSPSCGMGPVIIEDIKEKLSNLPKINEVVVEVVFDPPWSTDRMSAIAKIELGIM